MAAQSALQGKKTRLDRLAPTDAGLARGRKPRRSALIYAVVFRSRSLPPSAFRSPSRHAATRDSHQLDLLPVAQPALAIEDQFEIPAVIPLEFTTFRQTPRIVR